MSYSYNDQTDLIKLVYRGALYIKMYGKEYNTGIRLQLWTWNHMVWTWDHLSEYLKTIKIEKNVQLF